MRRSLLGQLAPLVLTAALIQAGSACSPTVLDFGSSSGGGGSGTGAGTGSLGRGGGSAGGAPLAHQPQICGGKTCPGGQACCYATSTCFDASAGAQACGNADGGTAPTFGSVHPGDQGNLCWSDLDCSPGQTCTANACAGPGNCEPPEGESCGYSSPPRTQCGCDGKDYPSRQAACDAGVRVAGARPCGKEAPSWSDDPTRIVCALDSNCPDGFRCCGYTGRCFDVTTPESCAAPGGAPGAACTEDNECQTDFCYETACGGPKVCTRDRAPSCNGAASPVCGCNGKSYRNRDCALSHHVTVAHDGACE